MEKSKPSVYSTQCVEIKTDGSWKAELRRDNVPLTSIQVSSISELLKRS